MIWSIESGKKEHPLISDTRLIAGLSVQLIEVACFLKLSADQLLVLVDRRLNYFRCSKIKALKRPCNK